MNKKLETLLEHVSTWPDEAQAELIQSIVEIEARHAGIYRLTDEEREAVRRGLQEMRDGKFATDEQVAAVFDRYRS
jgi:predicted transcriptional regulator